MKTVKVSLKENSYKIYIAGGSFTKLAQLVYRLELGTNAFIITNRKIFNLHAKKLKQALEKEKIRCYFYKVPDSEKSKSIDQYSKAIAKISTLNTKKRFFLAAFGGGVVGDLCGFIAATYKRGVPYVQIPTTLLSQVDSAIGGKTAIDISSGKNLIGAFYQPKLVYSNISLLNSLPARQIISGLAEVVKYGIIADKNLFSYLEKNYKKILKLDIETLEHVITVSSKIKSSIVAVDEKESLGLRTILNYGHTIGHALETASSYKDILNHGEAISIGMICAAEIAAEIGLFDKKSLIRMITLLQNLNLPQEARKINYQAVLRAFYRDKKFINAKIRMVLPTRIGHVIVTEDIPVSIINKIIKKKVACYGNKN